ncbi:hypothetical protein MPL3365_30897 [Mesorhizobium plurifarium]|uniref:Uncharacterized protein n=1 Tax=Mesorhizobium plurifarium TaxID=69974 RepID=A0A090GFG0_MESPL|nr:hypothetical protein MPL3365_30897 [Mesorhizobium plurifarium]
MARFVLWNSTGEVIGDTDVDRAAFLARGHVDVSGHLAISIGAAVNDHSAPRHSRVEIPAWILGSSRVASLLATP